MPPSNNNYGLYSKPTEHRKIPDMTPNGDLLKSSVLRASKNPSATAKRFVKAYQLVDSMEANAVILGRRYDCSGSQGDPTILELKKDVIYMKQCVSLIEAMSLTDQRVAVTSSVVENFPLPSCWCHVITLAPLEGKNSVRQLGNLNAESFVVLLATAIVVAMTNSSHLALLILHELRIHAEGNFAELVWEDLEFTPIDSLATKPTEAGLRFALGMVGVKMARRLYRQRDERKCFAHSKPVSGKVLLDSIETFARDQCKFRRTCGTGYWNLGWIAHQSVAKRGVHPLEGAAEMLGLMKQCFAIADVEDDDFLKAEARIEAAMCMVYGADGIVGYKVLGNQRCQAQRDMRSEKSRSAPQVGDITIAPVSASGDTDEITFACVEYEKRRMSTGVPATTQESGETLIIPRWEVLKLWNEAMSAYDSINHWGHGCVVYGETAGWDIVVDFLQRTSQMNVGQYAPAPLVPGFPVVRDRGYDGESRSTGCAFCGKINGATIMKCSRCKTATYCSKDCQIGDWKKHKPICKLLEK
jgi:hypothetical protein